jgi:hypothetical protein
LENVCLTWENHRHDGWQCPTQSSSASISRTSSQACGSPRTSGACCTCATSRHPTLTPLTFASSPSATSTPNYHHNVHCMSFLEGTEGSFLYLLLYLWLYLCTVTQVRRGLGLEQCGGIVGGVMMLCALAGGVWWGGESEERESGRGGACAFKVTRGRRSKRWEHVSRMAYGHILRVLRRQGLS